MDLIRREDAIYAVRRAYWERDVYISQDDLWIADVTVEQAIHNIKELSPESTEQMTLEALKTAAKEMGYRLAKDTSREKLLPCLCGCRQRERWYDKDGIILVCKKCGKRARGKSEAEARRNWNEKIRDEQNE